MPSTMPVKAAPGQRLEIYRWRRGQAGLAQPQGDRTTRTAVARHFVREGMGQGEGEMNGPAYVQGLFESVKHKSSHGQ